MVKVEVISVRFMYGGLHLYILILFSGPGLGFVLNRKPYPNDSIVLRNDIGEGIAALQCTTDSTTCCTNMNGERRAGEFYFPDGTKVSVFGSGSTPTYYRNRSSGFIALNRRPNGTITGKFRCEIPDASGTLVNLFINIVGK